MSFKKYKLKHNVNHHERYFKNLSDDERDEILFKLELYKNLDKLFN